VVVVAVAIGLAIGLVVGYLAAHRHAATAVGAAASRMDPDRAGLPRPDLATAVERMEHAVTRARQELADQRALSEEIRGALDALALGVVVAGPGGELLLRNRSAASFLQVHHADVLVDEAVHSLLGAAVNGRTSSRTLELYGPPRRSVVISADPVRAADGTVRAAVATIEDVTERLRLEAVRTDFVANISHELKTPVGALALLAEALQGEDDPELVDRLSQKMVFEAHRVARIIEDLLELSRIELSGQDQPAATSVALLVGQAVDRVRSLMQLREVRVVVDEPSTRSSVLGDRRQVVSAIANLLENAVKYSEPGSLVEVHSRNDGQWVEIDVVDHGMGIPSRDLDRIFERFYRVDRARSRETGGTGLGLAIVRHVATNHGGSVRVRSREGAGSTFTLRLPAGPGPVPVAPLRRTG
jgi:two-component system, OmpR family, sensor histidine kinase SenX3